MHGDMTVDGFPNGEPMDTNEALALWHRLLDEAARAQELYDLDDLEAGAADWRGAQPPY